MSQPPQTAPQGASVWPNRGGYGSTAGSGSGGGGGGGSSAPSHGGGGFHHRPYGSSAPASDATADVFFGGVSSLAEHLDRTMMLVLRDGRMLHGTLSSYDQYGSIVLEHAKERLAAQGKFADIDMGMYMIRGENIMLMGELVRRRV
jgi:small nuclear ribonucleoprotein (snRNP)-like protein